MNTIEITDAELSVMQAALQMTLDIQALYVKEHGELVDQNEIDAFEEIKQLYTKFDEIYF